MDEKNAPPTIDLKGQSIEETEVQPKIREESYINIPCQKSLYKKRKSLNTQEI